MPTQTRQESPSYRDRALPIDERVSDLLSRIERTGSTQLSADVVNVGDRSGTEVVQLYIRDRVSSVTRPVKELKAFQRVSLQPGERKTVSLAVTPESLAFYDVSMERVVEPGEFEIMVGSSSRDRDLERVILRVEP